MAEFEGMGYGKLKERVGEVVVEELRPIQERYNDIMKNKDYLNKIIKDNGEKASYYAAKTLRKVQHKVGFHDRIR